MRSVPAADERIQQTRAAYHEACAALGYATPSREADDVIDLLGVGADGARWARLAPFYPALITAAVDHAAKLARLYPEALLDDGERIFLDFLTRKATR